MTAPSTDVQAAPVAQQARVAFASCAGTTIEFYDLLHLVGLELGGWDEPDLAVKDGGG